MLVQMKVANDSCLATIATTTGTTKAETLTELWKQQPDSMLLVAEQNHFNSQWTTVETKERPLAPIQRVENQPSGSSGCERRKCKVHQNKELTNVIVDPNGHHHHHHHHLHNSCLDSSLADRQPLAPVADAVPAPSTNTISNCLICRNDDCRGNLYCNMLPARNNDGEIITINRKKSVIQNRRKSALCRDDLVAAVVDESAGKCDTIKSERENNKCSISLTLQSIHKCLRHPVDKSQTRRGSLVTESSARQDNDATNGCTRLNSTCETLDRVPIRGRANCCNSNLNSSNQDDTRHWRRHARCSFASRSLATSSLPSSHPPSTVSLQTTSQKLVEASATMPGTRKHNCTKAGGYRDGYHESDVRIGCSHSSLTSLVSSPSTPPVATSLLSTRPKSIFRDRSRTSMLSSSAQLASLNGILWFIASVILLNFTISLLVSATYSNVTTGSSGVCTSIDIRNKAQQLQNLTGCRVIEGFLVITLMDESNQTDFENYVFPELTEITDFLMLYRVSGIRSLAKLFPNLQVIRGNTLFEGFALIIFENANIEEIGLTSLVTINRGGVRIEKNPILCFVHTIDWNRIAMNATPETLIFKHNKATNECPLCGLGRIKGDVSSGDCPLIGNKRYCWNQDHCQKICPMECGNRACNSQGKCCNETCLGSCSEDGNTCAVCRNLVAYGKDNEKICVQECPANTYKHMNRRCLTKSECTQIAKPLRSNLDPHPYVPFEGQCLLNCKSGYEKVGQTCVPCHNKCAKQCDGKQILSILDAESLRGCTIIKENLMISIRQGGPHLIEDLESALSSIEEIGGYLKITRTYSIVSLSFFRRLRVIRGEYLSDSKYALYVLDNQNLQNLWGEHQNVTIERGRIFFHFNPKLCYNKIEALKPFIKENNTFDVAEVARDSNGDRVACDIQELDIIELQPYETAALISVKPIEFEDERVFLGYQYFYMEAPYQNVSIYENRHGCGYDSWDVDDDNNKDHRHLFTHLKPYTQYAVYVKTSTIASEKKGGQSKIHYFRTLPSTPDPVRNLEYTVLNYSSIEIRWIEPREPKGNLTEYHFSAEITYENPNILEQRNYCTEPIKENREIIPEEPKKPAIASEESCRSICKDLERHVTVKTLDEPPARENEIDFEDAIQNFVYVRRSTTDDQKRQKRSLRPSETYTDTLPQRNDDDDDDIPPEEELRKIKVNGTYTVYGESVNASTKSFIFTGLKHYSRYKIYVRACREGTGKRCSMKTRIYPRTAKKDGADDIQNLTAHIENINNTRNSVRLTWKEPLNPNGLIVSYSIKYYRVDIEHAKHVDKCITHREYENSTKGYILHDMDSGNYSVQVMATSLAGDGNYCKPVYFYIKESRISTQTIVMILAGVIIFIVICGIFIWRLTRRCLPPPDDLKLFTSVNPEYISMQYTPDEWEIPREKIIQLRELGQGSFGMVYEGIVKNLQKDGEDVPCAIKTVNENATDRERINFLNEASVMKAFDTFHVVRLLGVVSRDQPTLVIMELMTNGDLKGYLRSNRPDSEQAKTGEVQVQPPTLKRILQMAIEIADGMAYLSAKKFVHRDLAARNCMVAHDLTVKIGDFGMTRDIYETDYYRKGTKGLLPVRWMAPESLKDGVFSSSSDVFSYGVVLWEMATLASQPYQGLSNDQVLRYVIDGGVMERPENCPDKLYNLMRRCWQHRPSARPTFMEIIENLLEDAHTRFREISFFHSDHGQEIYRQMQAVPTDVDDTTPLRTDMEVGTGNDDFKHGGTNYLTERSQEPQHSPYSLGSGTAAINSIPDGTSKQSNDNSSPSTVTTNNLNKETATTTSSTAATVQSFSNSLVPPRLRRMWRNAFLGNGNSNYSNRSCNGAGGGGTGVSGSGGSTTAAALESGILNAVDAGTGAKASGTGSNSGGGSNSGTGLSSGLGGILSGLRGFGQNSSSGGGGSSRFMRKDFSTKGGQKMSQETITNPLLNDTSFDEITPPHPLPVDSKPDVQCNHNDDKVKNSSLSNSNRLNQLSSPYHQQKQPEASQADRQNEQQWLYSNGYVPSSNPAAPLLPSKSSPQPYQGVGGSNIRDYASRFSPRLKKATRPSALGDNLIPKPDDVGSNYRKLLSSPSAVSTPQPPYQQKLEPNQPSVRNERINRGLEFRDGSSTLVRRSPPSTSS